MGDDRIGPDCECCGSEFRLGEGGDLVKSGHMEEVVTRRRGPHEETEMQEVISYTPICDDCRGGC